MSELHPTEQFHWLTTHRDSALSGLLCTIAAWSLAAIGGLSPSLPVKVGAFSTGIVVCVAGQRSRRVAQNTAAILQDVSDISDQARQNRLYHAFRPGSQATISLTHPDEPIHPFDWELLKTNPNQFPHILIEGATGTGKTSLAEWLLHLLDGQPLVITPKRKQSQWRGIRVLGPPLDFQTIQKAFDMLLEVMVSRYDQMNSGVESYPQVNFVIDEYPLIAASCDVSNSMVLLVRAAREAKMRMLLLSQGSEGKTLDIEGQTSVRDCFVRIRLGKIAIDHAKRLKQSNLVTWLEQQERPCMVDDLPAKVPTINGFQSSQPTSTMGFPDVQSPIDKLSENSTEQQVKRLLDVGKTKKEIIWEVWKQKPGRGKGYANAKQEYERILRKCLDSSNA